MTPRFAFPRPLEPHGQGFTVLLVFLAALLLNACSGGRDIVELSADQLELLDSIPFAPAPGEDNPLFGQFPGHRAYMQPLGPQGTEVLQLEWWKGPTHDHRIRLPWPDGAPHDLASVEDLGAVHFMMRTRRPNRPVATLSLQWEDESGHCSETHIAPRHAEYWPPDTVWQDIHIPISDFDRGRSGTNWSNLITLNLKMDDFGDVLLGEFMLVPHAPRKTMKKWLKRNPLKAPVNNRFNLFDEELNCVWGMGEFPERHFQVKEKRGRNKSRGLDMEWDFSPNALSGKRKSFPSNTVGFSWNGWQPMAAPIQPDQAFIVFKLRNIGINQGPNDPLPIQVGVADADGATSSVFLTQDLLPGTGFGKWQECRIPFSAFHWATEADPSGLSSIAYVFFQFKEKGHVYIDDLQVWF